MITNEQFKALKVGDVFYRSGERYKIERIEHRTIKANVYPSGPNTTIYEANARAMGSKRGTIWFTTFLNLRPFHIERVTDASKVRKSRAYATRRDYPFVKRIDESPLETSESKDCTVRALAIVSNTPYDTAHAFLAKRGRKPHKGIFVDEAYRESGLVYTPHWQRSTYGKVLKSGMLPARAIVVTKGHVHAVIDGVTYDTGRIGSSKKVIGWYSFPQNKA